MKRLLAILFLAAAVAQAHSGPPFAILVDRRVGPAMVSVWANPDVGTGTFFVILDAPPGGKIPDDLKVSIGVQPVSGRLKEVLYSGERQDLRGPVQFNASAQFDAQEMWRVRVILASAHGGGEAAVNVEVTPPGLGRWDLLLYLLPFLGAGFLWFRAMQRRRRKVESA